MMRKLPQLLAEVVAGVISRRTLGLAAQMSFWMFLSLVPLLAVGGFVAARVATSYPWKALSAMEAVPPQVRELVMKEADHIVSWRGVVAPIAAATFVWTASTGVAAVFDALELQSGAQPRSWLAKRVLAIGACIALSVGAALITLLESGVAWLVRIAGAHLPAWLVSLVHGPVGTAARWFVGVLIAIAMVAGLYRVGVPRRGRDRGTPVLAGAVVAVALMVGLGLTYGFYVTKLGGSGSVYQAGLAAVGITLMTMWLFSIALLLGAQLNCVLAARLRVDRTWPRSAASSSPPISRTPPTAQSTPRSSSQPASARR
jgi:membrane protein